MEANPSLNRLIGFGRLDMAVGEWLACDDVAGFTDVRNPQPGEKLYVRELLRLLGKRFPTPLAALIWQQIEDYRSEIVATFAPPQGAIGQPGLATAAAEWYSACGYRFEKEWYLQNTLEFRYARTGRERVRSRWMRLLHPALLYFAEAGFSAGEILGALRLPRFGGLAKSVWLLHFSERRTQARFIVELAGLLLGFEIEPEEVEGLLVEITVQAARLSARRGYPVEVAPAALDYFQRLELGGLALHPPPVPLAGQGQPGSPTC